LIVLAVATGNDGAILAVTFHVLLIAYVSWRSDAFTNDPVR
jgi:hypothetical protein